jgi:hypothetical protein
VATILLKQRTNHISALSTLIFHTSSDHPWD